MWVPDCLPPTYPLFTCQHSPLFGLPFGVRGRCAGINIEGVVIHCIAERNYVAERCSVPRHLNQRGRRHHDSMHWFITSTGALIQMVDEEDVAWGFGEPSNNPCLSASTWPPLSGLTPAQYDCALIHVGIETTMHTGAYYDCACDCSRPTPNDLVSQTLTRLIAAIARKYNWPISSDRFIVHDELFTCADECECVQTANLICASRNYCERPAQFSEEDYQTLPAGETVEYVLGITNTGRIVKIPRGAL
jgi:hypothetical protein